MDWFSTLLGEAPVERITITMLARAIVVFFCALLLVRVGHRRFMGQHTAFDFVLAIMVGSILSRAVNGAAPLFPSVAAVAVIIALHWVLSFLSYRSDACSRLLKGRGRVIVSDGKVLPSAMCRSHIGEGDLMESLRKDMHREDLAGVEKATLERNGRISFVQKPVKPAVVEVAVEPGVQTVRIELR